MSWYPTPIPQAQWPKKEPLPDTMTCDLGAKYCHGPDQQPLACTEAWAFTRECAVYSGARSATARYVPQDDKVWLRAP